MKSVPNGPGFDPRPVRIEDLKDPARAEEALAHWDDLDPGLLKALEDHPQHGPRLAMLRRADLWLESRLGSSSRPDACPSAEELYDYGRGPGYGPLSSPRRAEIERHLIRCGECESSVETLATPPPVPLDSLVGHPAWNRVPPPLRAVRPSPSPIIQEPALKRRLQRLPRLVPLAVAASLVLALGIWIAIIPSGRSSFGFPSAPLLRGSSGGPLYFPRERVSISGPAAVELFPALGSDLVFEIEPQPGATAYSIDVARHGGDAFAVEGEVVLRLSGDSRTLRTARTLAPGDYTWTARAEVRGLPRELGARDFAVVADDGLERRLLGLRDRAEPARSLEAVRILHERGYLADARAIARTMPESAERDAYLGQVPGR
ncbi:MAG: hypothetical protein ACKVXR_01970 [Planctomycetota bacterium]